MSDQYVKLLEEKNYELNIIIEFAGQYFGMHNPDSGLVIPSQNLGVVSSLNVNPTSIDPERATTTINTSSFSLLDKGHVITKLFLDKAGFRTGEPVSIYLGRLNRNLDFSDYLKLPTTYINKCQKVESKYNFTTVERKDRMNEGQFSIQSKISVNILAAATVIPLQTIPDNLPTVGFGKIDDEFISWNGIDYVDNYLTGVVRGEFGSIPDDHSLGADIFNVTNIVSVNGIDLIMQMLVSGSGDGSAYDVLPEGAGIPSNLVDIAQMEQIRDTLYTGFNLSLKVYGLSSFKKYLESEIFLPLGVRLRENNNGKIGLALINRNIFEIDAPLIDETITLAQPGFSVSDDKVINQVRIYYNYHDGLNIYQGTYELEDAESIANYGARGFTELKFEGVKDESFAINIANLFLARFSIPRPEISVRVQNSAANLLIGDKSELISTRIPNNEGNLDFVSTLEVVKKSYNIPSGTITFQLSFTSFSGIRQCFIAPSDTIINAIDQRTFEISPGRGSLYRAGWKMKLYNNGTRQITSEVVRTIESVVGDVITFTEDFTTTITNYDFKLMFANYNEVIAQQRKFCFISPNNTNFDDGSKSYQITFS